VNHQPNSQLFEEKFNQQCARVQTFVKGSDGVDSFALKEYDRSKASCA
jgi:hypothetical protein